MRVKYAFTVTELIIVMAILGILAAVAMPTFQNHVSKTKESTAKHNLRLLRDAIGRYTIENGVAPGYQNNDTTNQACFLQFFFQFLRDGNYLSSMPKNPFNNEITVKVLNDNTELSANVTGKYGWVYRPATIEITIDWPGKDSEGIEYCKY